MIILLWFWNRFYSCVKSFYDKFLKKINEYLFYQWEGCRYTLAGLLLYNFILCAMKILCTIFNIFAEMIFVNICLFFRQHQSHHSLVLMWQSDSHTFYKTGLSTHGPYNHQVFILTYCRDICVISVKIEMKVLS